MSAQLNLTTGVVYVRSGQPAPPVTSVTIAGNRSAAAWTVNGIGLVAQAATYTDTTSAGTVALQAVHALAVPTVAASSATTYTDSATFYIAGAPTAGTNVIQTSAWAAYLNGTSFIAKGVFGTNVAMAISTAIGSAAAGNLIARAVGSGQFAAVIEANFSGATNASTGAQGLNAIAATQAASSGNVTGTTVGGGLRNRYQAAHLGTGTVSMASAASGLVATGASGNSPVTDSAVFHVEPVTINASSTWGTHSGLWVRGGSVSGTLTTRYGVRIDDLVGGTTRYGIYQAGAADLNYFAGAVSFDKAVNLLSTGGAAVAGTVTLVGGTATVNTTAATATCLIQFQRKTSGGTIGTSTTYTVSAGTSFTITSDNILDTSTFAWQIIETH